MYRLIFFFVVAGFMSCESNQEGWNVKIENNTNLNTSDLEQFKCCGETFSLDDDYCDQESIKSCEFVPYSEAHNIDEYLLVTLNSNENDSVDFNLEIFALEEGSDEFKRKANFGSLKIDGENYISDIQTNMCLFVNK